MRQLASIVLVAAILAAGAAAAAAEAGNWTDSSGAYRAKVLAGDQVPMAGYFVRAGANAWPELAKVSDRHTHWGHQRIGPASFGTIVPGPAELPVRARAEQRGGFARTLVYSLPDGQTCSFTFNVLSPALWMDSRASSFTAFAGTTTAPRIMAYAGAGGIQLAHGTNAAVDGSAMAESWILVWRGTNSGYQNHFVPSFLHASPNQIDHEDYNNYVREQPADAPWLIVFQRRPSRITLQANGVLAEFPGASGTTAFLPIGGFRWYRGSDTARWAEQFPAEVAARCRAWSRYLKFMPTSMSEQYTVSGDVVQVRSSFQFTAVADDWNTQGVRLAPIPSVTSLALLSKLKNLSISPANTVDLDYPTLTGALMGIENADGYTLSFSGWRQYATVPEPRGTVTPNARIQQKLEDHLKDMLAAGHLAPYASMQGTLQYSFWGNPGDLASTLIAVRRHVGPDLQRRIDDYLKAENEKYPILRYGWLPPQEGARRESHPVDLSVPDVVGRRRNQEGPRIENLYGLWEYSRQYNDWGWMQDQWDVVRRIVDGLAANNDWEMGFRNGGVHDLNARIKGIVGYYQIARQKNDAAADEAAYLLAQALVNRFAFAKLSEYAFISGQYYVPEGFDLPRFHARNAHKFNVFLPAYRKGASYRSAPQVGYVSSTDRYLSEIGNFWHDHSIWIFTDLTPPLAKFLKDTTWSELQNYLMCVEEGLPTWYVTKAENLHAIGEDAYHSPYMSWPIFMARAMIYDEPAATLAGYIDLPDGRGDLYYLQKLVATLEAR